MQGWQGNCRLEQQIVGSAELGGIEKVKLELRPLAAAIGDTKAKGSCHLQCNAAHWVGCTVGFPLFVRSLHEVALRDYHVPVRAHLCCWSCARGSFAPGEQEGQRSGVVEVEEGRRRRSLRW